ncbi:MAG: molecular chaperone DnaK [Deltaproteobacteria bacterium]|nr:molecular chaperone DnaK [Deltaproteobacteria bacterium]
MSEGSSKRVVGIDLGTTNSCVALLEGTGVTVIPNPDGGRTTPSVVAFARQGERLVGPLAKRQAATNPEGTVYAVKRLMGRKYSSSEVARHRSLCPYRIVEAGNGDARVEIDGAERSPAEISAMVLRYLKDAAEAYVGGEVTDAVITCPAYFDDAQRQATKDAGRIAGFTVRRIINEPTAAALAFGRGGKGKEEEAKTRRIAVYDLGGGTFDVSVLELSRGVYTVRSTAGNTFLGGEDFDQRLIDLLADEFQKAESIDLRQDARALQRLREAAEKAKHELSSGLETEINLPFIAGGASGPKHLTRSFKRSEFEKLVADLIDRTFEPCKQALADAHLAPGDLDDVLLVGGMTRMPAIRKRVEEYFGKPPNAGLNPDEVVAAGAAIQGAALEGQTGEVLLLDVTPLSLGVETGGGVFTRLIPRNTTVPARKREVFTTSLDNQPFVPVHILQGEREMAADNKSLARFELVGIPPAPRGVPQIEVTFDIDADGILSVTARDLGTGRKHAVQVTAASGLTKAEVDGLLQEADSHKTTDSLRRARAEAKNTAEALLYTSKKALAEFRHLLSAEDAQSIDDDVRLLESLLAEAPVEKLREATKQLESSAYRIAEAVYAGTGQASEPAQPAQPPPAPEGLPPDLFDLSPPGLDDAPAGGAAKSPTPKPGENPPPGSRV